MKKKIFDLFEFATKTKSKTVKVNIPIRAIPSEVDSNEYILEKEELVKWCIENMTAAELMDVIAKNPTRESRFIGVYIGDKVLMNEYDKLKEYVEKQNKEQTTFSDIKEKISEKVSSISASDIIEDCKKFARNSCDYIQTKASEINEDKVKPLKSAIEAGLKAACDDWNNRARK